MTRSKTLVFEAVDSHQWIPEGHSDGVAVVVTGANDILVSVTDVEQALNIHLIPPLDMSYITYVEQKIEAPCQKGVWDFNYRPFIDFKVLRGVVRSLVGVSLVPPSLDKLQAPAWDLKAQVSA